MKELAIKALLILGLLGAVWAFGNHHGYSNGEAAGDQRATKAEGERDDANRQKDVLASKLQDINGQTAEEKAKADAQKAKADQAIADLAKEKAGRATDEASWNRKLQKAANSNDCPTLKEELCDSVMDY